MKVAVLFSGGKDSCLALHKSKLEGHEITSLLSILPENFDSFMFHKPYLNLLEKQAEMLDIELIIKKIKGEEEIEVNDLKQLIAVVKDKVGGIVVGGIASSYQGKKIKKICDDLNLKFIAPIWDYKSEEVWKELLNEGFKVILTKVSCEGLNENWLGKVIDNEKFLDLKKLSEKYKFRMDFEGGEAESAVLLMPEFKEEIKIKTNIVSEDKYRHFIDNLKILN